MGASRRAPRGELLEARGLLLERSEDRTPIRARAKPCFPDAPTADAEVVFVWPFVQMHDSTGMNRNGDLEDCWLVHDIEPDWGGWTVFV